ncbi:hypothetical protein BDV93DRAFT_548968 [Ceratobasidium sp. AG-I]|nr:hypothetical protein BDV93DRAFT_548968 [Ceratobasidium sp. AG-I]
MSRHETTPNACAEVYRSWKSARDALSQSIQTFLNACDILTSISIEKLTQSAGTWGSSLPDALGVIDAELSGLANEEERLRKARLLLLVSRNSSKTFTKINSLPAEILSSIFLAGYPHQVETPTHRRHTYPETLSSVCQHWRHVATNFPPIWSDVHVYINGSRTVNSQKCAELWSQRSRNALIRLEIEELDAPKAVGNIRDISFCLARHASHVGHLKIYASFFFIDSALDVMIQHHAAGSTKSLSLGVRDDPTTRSCHLEIWESPDDYDDYDDDDDNDDDNDDEKSLSRTEKFSSSIQYLELLSITISWNSPVYHGLVELSIDLTELQSTFNHSPTQSEIQKILLLCPMLQKLSLEQISTSGVLNNSIEPINLPNLRTIKLASRGDFVCQGILPLLSPSSGELDVEVSVHDDPGFLNEFRSFLFRSTVTKLHVRASRPTTWFISLTEGLSHLESLTLSFYRLDDTSLQTLLSTTSDTPSSRLWPKLHTLHLSSCEINEDWLASFLQHFSIHTLRIEDSCLIYDRSGEGRRLYRTKAEFRQVATRLSAYVPDLSVKHAERR